MVMVSVPLSDLDKPFDPEILKGGSHLGVAIHLAINCS
jgi:hypothetical protein